MTGWVITGLVDRPATSQRTDWLTGLRAGLRNRRRARAARAHSLRMSGNDVRSLPGSEHSHMLRHRRF
jgi:hypothetical protein